MSRYIGGKENFKMLPSQWWMLAFWKKLQRFSPQCYHRHSILLPRAKRVQLSENPMEHLFLPDRPKGHDILSTRTTRLLLPWVVIIILKGSACDLSLITWYLIIRSLVLSHSTPFVQPWKGRSGTGLARVRGGRSGPGQTRLNFHSFRLSLRYCSTFIFVFRW